MRPVIKYFVVPLTVVIIGGVIVNSISPISVPPPSWSLDPVPEGGMVAFVTSAKVKGDLTWDGDSAIGSEPNKVLRADKICEQLAARSPVLQRIGRAEKSYKAWLSDNERSPKGRFSEGKPYYQYDADTKDWILVSSNHENLFNGSLAHALNRNEEGFLEKNVYVWTGTTEKGESLPPNCREWISSSAQDRGAVGYTRDDNKSWTNMILEVNGETRNKVKECNTPRGLYCFEQAD